MTFVFTNQISGKLVPVESVVKSKPDVTTDTGKGKSYTSHVISSKPSSFISRSKLPTFVKPSQDKHFIGRSTEGTSKSNVSLKPKPSLPNYLPQKRLSSAPVDDDDDDDFA